VGNEVLKWKKHDTMEEKEMGCDEGMGTSSSGTMDIANPAERQGP